MSHIWVIVFSNQINNICAYIIFVFFMQLALQRSRFKSQLGDQT
jgi:hypothetical protein